VSETDATLAEDAGPAPRSAVSEAGAGLAEAQRQFDICNACRYCEGYCAVFPAMEERSLFLEGDFSYLAHLCHDCRACYQACPYTEPHELAVNIPALMAERRVETYRRHARPAWLLALFTGGPAKVLALTLAVLAVMVAVMAACSSLSLVGRPPHGPGSFYALVPHATMLATALLLSAFALGVVTLGTRGYWREIRPQGEPALLAPAWATTLREVFALRWMRGGGGECFFPEQMRASPVRRRLHALVMYGFLATFAATVSAFVAQEVLGKLPPYPLLSVPVLLGLLGGVALALGCLGLVWQRRHSPGELSTPAARALDSSLLISLLAVAISGLALLCLRDRSAMGTMLGIHLATVAALYLTLPYGKFVHVAYRTAAVLRSALERRARA
jgi:citrate/tricarballylate utilization protein